MKYKLIEKAAKIYEKIKVLDKEIIEIDRMAQLFAGEETEVNFQLHYQEPKKEEKENILEEDGSLASLHRMMREAMMPRLTWGIDYAAGCAPKEKKQSYQADISNTFALQMLGVLLGDKQNKRMKLISEIEKIMSEKI